MVTLNSALKLMVVASALLFLLTYVSLPQNHCQACELKYEGKVYDGYEAYEYFEDGCISYAQPQDAVNLSDIKIK